MAKKKKFNRPVTAPPKSAEPSLRSTEGSQPPDEAGGVAGPMEHSRVRHETRDVRFRVVAGFVVVSSLVLGGQLYLVWKAFEQGEQYVERDTTQGASATARSEARLPLAPRLEQLNRMEGVDRESVARIGASDIERMKRFGATKEQGYIHIPIQEAMEFVVDRLPIRGQTKENDYRSRGLVNGGESNSGRMFRGAMP